MPSNGSHIGGKEAATLEYLRTGSLKPDWIESQLCELVIIVPSSQGSCEKNLSRAVRQGQRIHVEHLVSRPTKFKSANTSWKREFLARVLKKNESMT